MQEEIKAADVVATETQTPVEGEKKPDPIRMSSQAVGEVASFLNQKIVELIGEIEYYERARAAGHPIPVAQTDYLAVKLRDLSIIRDSLTSVFYYKRLDEEEMKQIQAAYQEALQKAETEKAQAQVAEAAQK